MHCALDHQPSLIIKRVSRIRIRFLKRDQRKNRVVWPPEMSHNILYRNDATASPKRLRTTKIQIPGEDRIASSGNDFDLGSFSDAQGIEKRD